MATIQLGRTKSANKLISYAEKRATVLGGVDCPTEYAKAQMRATRELWGKNDGVQAHHVIQSFKPGEVTAEQANELGQKLAKKIAKGYECAVYTHTDKDHIHNHIVINSVSYEDGRKYQAHGKAAIKQIRQINDEICKEYGLFIVKEPNGSVRYTLAEKALIEKNKDSWKDRIRSVIDDLKEKVRSLEGFKEGLKENNIELNIRGKTWTYHDLLENKKVRATRLGADYEKGAVLDGIERQTQLDYAREQVDDSREERVRRLADSVRRTAQEQRRLEEKLRREQEERKRANSRSTPAKKSSRSYDLER